MQILLSMVSFAKTINSSALLTLISIRSVEFPWKELGHGTSVCDVGGGIGNMTLQLAKAYPTSNLKLQDLPERILQAKNEIWPKECPEAIEEERIQFEPIDFLSESPIQGCDVYYASNSYSKIFKQLWLKHIFLS